jgi:putative transposase
VTLLGEPCVTARLRTAVCATCSKTLWGSWEVEWLQHGQRFVTRRQANDEVFAWLLWYNHTRQHPTLACVSPVRFKQVWLAAQAMQVNS